MRLNEELFERTEEFLDLIANEEKSEGLDSAMDSLRCFLEQDVDGWTNETDETLALSVLSRLEEIWDLISAQEKQDNSLLEEHVDDLMNDLEQIICEEVGVDLEEEEECEGETEEYFEDSFDDCEEESWD